MEKEESQLDKKGSLLDSKSDHKGSSKDDPKVQLVQSKKDEVCHPEKSDPASSSILPKQSAEKNAFAKEEPSKQSSQEKIGDSLIDKEDIGEGEQRQIQESPQQVSEENNKEDTSEKSNQEKIGNPLSEKEDMVEGENRQIQETPEHISEENNAKDANQKTQKEEGELQESSQSDQEKSVQQNLNETAESVIISKHQAKNSLRTLKTLVILQFSTVKKQVAFNKKDPLISMQMWILLCLCKKIMMILLLKSRTHPWTKSIQATKIH